MADFHTLWPEKFSNKTNGVMLRRWLALSNSGLNTLLSKQLGENWIQIYPSCDGWNPMPRIPPAEAEWRFIKRMIKEGFAAALLRRTGIVIDPATLLDLQDKRIYEYKRQHLNVLHITALYQRIKSDSDLDIQLRIFIFGSKAAPGYHMAKLIIKLINTVAEMVNKDPGVCDRLKLVFLPNFNICNSQRIYPAAEILEHISTAAKEASGTGNMKFTLNGALTIGTLDGANVEIRQEVGVENFFLFGLTAQEVPEL